MPGTWARASIPFKWTHQMNLIGCASCERSVTGSAKHLRFSPEQGSSRHCRVGSVHAVWMCCQPRSEFLPRWGRLVVLLCPELLKGHRSSCCTKLSCKNCLNQAHLNTGTCRNLYVQQELQGNSHCLSGQKSVSSASQD